jgi:coatomer subunit beta'
MAEIDDSQFKNELELLKKLEHQNIVQLVGLCNEEGEDFVKHKGNLTRMQVMRRALCLEFVPNGSLGKFLCGNPSLNMLLGMQQNYL